MVAVALVTGVASLGLLNGGAIVAQPRATPAQMLAVPKWASAAALAAAVTLAPVNEAIAMDALDLPTTLLAGRSGGRAGGRVGAAPRAAPRPSAVAPRSSAPISPRAAPAPAQRTTNVYMQPAMPMGGMGMGYGGYGGGYGYGGGGNGMGLYLGLSLAETFLREQQRQAYLQQQLRVQQQLGQDQAAIASLQSQLSAQNAKMSDLKEKNGGVAPAVDAETEATLKLKLQMIEQQKELEQLKAANAAKEGAKEAVVAN